MKPVDLKAIREHVEAAAGKSCGCEPRAGESCEVCDPVIQGAGVDPEELLELSEQLTRVLLPLEWVSDGFGDLCPECDRRTHMGHASDCPIDAALTAAGLDTQEKRDAARERLR